MEERGYDGGEDHVESCLLTKTELARRKPERALLYRGIGAVRVRATHADRDNGDEKRCQSQAPLVINTEPESSRL